MSLPMVDQGLAKSNVEPAIPSLALVQVALKLVYVFIWLALSLSPPIDDSEFLWEMNDKELDDIGLCRGQLLGNDFNKLY